MHLSQHAARDCKTCELFKFRLSSHLNPVPTRKLHAPVCVCACVSVQHTITITHHLSGKQMMLHVTLSSHIRCRQCWARLEAGRRRYTLGQALGLDAVAAQCSRVSRADSARTRNEDKTQMELQWTHRTGQSTAWRAHTMAANE